MGKRARQAIDASMSELQLQAQVVQLAQAAGWLVFHPYDSRHSTRGYPDLTFAHPQRGVVFVELKTQHGYLTRAQRDWFNTLQAAGARAYIWRPSDWDEAVCMLTGQPNEGEVA